MTAGSCCGPLSFADHSAATEEPERIGTLPVAIIGAGPVGLAAAAHLAKRHQRGIVLEAGPGPGATIREWNHVRLFSPWRFCLDRAAVELLEEVDWIPPELESLPTGGELIERYLEPLAGLPSIRPMIRYHHRVTGVTREGRDRLKGTGRSEAPFVVRYRTGEGATGEVRARAVIDASGTWNRARPLGADGLVAVGEEKAAARIEYGIPDVLGSVRARYAGQRTAVVGAGHSAANVLLDLDRLAREVPETEVVWVVRGGRPGRLFERGDDQLQARGALEERLRRLVESQRLRMVTGFGVRCVEAGDDGLRLLDRDGRMVVVDRIVAATGFRPDLHMVRELRLDLDPITEAPRKLGPLIDPNEHSCGTVPPHGEAELRHPEPGFYLVGVKSYGRAPTFLLPTGYEQVRSVVAALAGDMEAAANVELVLPETGVCSVDAASSVDRVGEEEVCSA